MSDQNRDPGKPYGVDVVQKTIDRANATNILDIFGKYSLHIDATSKKACCPFPTHKGGNERSPSFYYYPDTNSFFCFGCQKGGRPTDFVAFYEDLTRYTAANVILNDHYDSFTSPTENFPSGNKYALDFAHMMRNFLIAQTDNPQALPYAENVAAAFDSIRNRYVLEQDGYEMMIKKLKRKLDAFECQS